MVKNVPAIWEIWVRSLVGKIPWRRAWWPTPVLLPGESHVQRCLVGYSSWGHKEWDMTERLSTHLFIESPVGFWIGVTLWIFSLHSLRSWAALAGVLAISSQGMPKAFPASSGSLRPCCSWPLPSESLLHASWISALSQEACMNLIVLTEDLVITGRFGCHGMWGLGIFSLPPSPLFSLPFLFEFPKNSSFQSEKTLAEF